jgi:hypothetical protein
MSEESERASEKISDVISIVIMLCIMDAKKCWMKGEINKWKQCESVKYDY